MSITTYTATRDEIVSAFVRWETARREGATMAHDEADALPVDQRAEWAADALIEFLFPA